MRYRYSLPVPVPGTPYTRAPRPARRSKPMEAAECSTLHIVLLRRDLRVSDQPALTHAAAACASNEGERLLVVYVYDPALLCHPTASTAHFHFIDDCLAEVAADLQARGSALFLRSGHLVGILESFRRLARTMVLWSNRVVGLAAERERDAQTSKWCTERGVRWHDLPSNGVIPHEECVHAWPNADFQNQWAQKLEEHCDMNEECLPAASAMPPPPDGLRHGARLSMEALVRLGVSNEHGIAREGCQRGGTRAGRSLLHTFLHQRSYGYRSKLSSPVTAEEACSRLSPHLAWGTLSLRQVVRALHARCVALHAAGGARNREWLVSLEGFRMRLHWRSHNMQKFEVMPHVETRNLMSGYDGLRDEGHQSDEAFVADQLLGVRPTHDPQIVAMQATEALSPSSSAPAPALMALSTSTVPVAELNKRFSAWAAGRTGYPLVDACMRCLDSTGWLTFRMRCLCVSFACYHMWLHWRRPAVWLARRFVDFEPGIHFCQMQMQAGCAEYVEMRVYNPIKQAQDQDPNGTFIRKWLPELGPVPLQYLHEPARMPKAVQREVGCVLGVDYPRPVVEHQLAYTRAKHLLQQRRNAMGLSTAPGSGAAGRKKHAVQPSGNGDLRKLLGGGDGEGDGSGSGGGGGDGGSGGGRDRGGDAASGNGNGMATIVTVNNSTAQGRKRERPGEMQPPEVQPLLNAECSAAVEAVASPSLPSASAVDVPLKVRRVDQGREDEMRTCAQLAAAGFPPELARRAASAYPTNVERAADWILSTEW